MICDYSNLGPSWGWNALYIGDRCDNVSNHCNIKDQFKSNSDMQNYLAKTSSYYQCYKYKNMIDDTIFIDNLKIDIFKQNDKDWKMIFKSN